MNRFIFSLVIVMTIFVTFTTNAQVTTSSLSGKVVDQMDIPLVGANIIANHLPSGTQYGTVSNIDGRYTIQGMRSGGPYTITISYVGMESQQRDDIVLKLGETYNLDVQLTDSDELLDGVTITAKSGIDATKTGAAMSIARADIEKIPTISHSISDIARLNPQISVSGAAISFAGSNNRYNSFQIDGAMNNDVFGLTSNGANGGQAGTQPVSMETIEQIQINVAPFDIRQSGFTGGSINAITKSGTNEFHGSVYGFGNNQNLIGSYYELLNGRMSSNLNKQMEALYGFTFGGPIIQNKLFFFANFERHAQRFPNPYGLGQIASNIDAKLATKVYEHLKQLANDQGLTYNGTLSTVDDYTLSNKGGIKIDWNINSNNNFIFRWSIVDAKQNNKTSGPRSLNSSDFSYDFISRTNTFIAELQSRFSTKINNEARFSYVRVRDRRKAGDPFPMISINNVGDGTLNLGNEYSSMANRLEQDVLTFTDNLSCYFGNHVLTFGTHNEFYQFTNLFIQNLYGSYSFNSPEDFFNGKINRYRYNNTLTESTGMNPSWESTFRTGQIGFYAQDKWILGPEFDITYGIRMDIPLFFDTPIENSDFNKLSEEKGWNVKTNQKLNAMPLFSPRLGFRYKPDGTNTYVIRGGVGIFTGRIPFVWLSNSFTNTGMTMNTYNTYNTEDLALILDPNGQQANSAKMKSNTQTINVFNEKFRFAQNLRTNIGFDFELFGIDWTADCIYSKTLNDILYRNLTSVPDENKTLADKIPGMDFDNRPIFTREKDTRAYYAVYELSNTNKGYSYSLSLKGEKRFDFGLDLMASYTFTQSKSINSGTSSVAASNWNYNYTHGNPNEPELSFSAFNRPHRVNVSAYYTTRYGRNDAWQFTIGMIYSGTSGSPYSIYYYGDLNGDSSNGNDLIFIPTDEQIDKMPFRENNRYSADQQRSNMKAWIANDPYMKNHRGEYYDRYADNMPFEHQFDFHIAHKYNFKVGRYTHGIELNFDIINIANIFNPKWGRHYSNGYPYYFSPITYDSKSNSFSFLHDANYKHRSYQDGSSRWRAQIGLKYTF